MIPTRKQTIIWDKTQTPRSCYFDDVYFNTDGAISESTYVFIDGNNLYERFLQHTTTTFVVGETGFGSGLNFLILWKTFLQFRQQNTEHPLRKLQFYSVEKYPLSQKEMIDIHQVIIKDDTLQQLAIKLQKNYYQKNCLFEEVSLTILLADVNQFPLFLAQNNHIIDAWFFDGFSPQKNPEMWAESLFNACFQVTALHGSFATFSAAGFVRRNLVNAGFIVNKRKGYGIKREMLIGTKRS